jgi:hypothetical protein
MWWAGRAALNHAGWAGPPSGGARAWRRAGGSGCASRSSSGHGSSASWPARTAAASAAPHETFQQQGALVSVSGRAAQLVPLARDVAAGCCITDHLGDVGQPVGSLPGAPRRRYHIRAHGDLHSLGPPGMRGRRRGSGGSAGGRATATTGLGFGAGRGFVLWRGAGRSGFGSGSGRATRASSGRACSQPIGCRSASRRRTPVRRLRGAPAARVRRRSARQSSPWPGRGALTLTISWYSI